MLSSRSSLLVLVATALLALAGCRDKARVKPAPKDVASAATAASGLGVRPDVPPIQLQVRYRIGAVDTTDVKTPWGTCSAADSDGKLEISCHSAPEQVDLRASLKGQPEVQSTHRKGERAHVTLTLMPAFLAVLGKVSVPPPEAMLGSPKRQVNLTSPPSGDEYPKVTLDPRVTFTAVGRGAITRGTVAPMEMTLVEALRGRVELLATMAPSGILFADEKTDDAPPKVHSLLHLTARSARILGTETVIWGFEVVGPAKVVGDADLIVVEESTFTDAGKSCGGYRVKDGPDAGKIESLPLWAEKKSLTLRERRTGRELAKTQLDAAKQCPAGFNMTSEKKVRANVQYEPVDKWLATQLRMKR